MNLNCLLENCVKDATTFDSGIEGDCLKHHLNCAVKEIKAAMRHYDAMKAELKEVIKKTESLEAELENEKRKQRKQRMREIIGKDKTFKAVKSLEAPKRTLATCDTNSDSDDGRFFKTKRKLGGKENSPKKVKDNKSNEAQHSVAISFSSVNFDGFVKKSKTSIPKQLKQPTLDFLVMAKKTEDRKIEDSIDTDATFCESIENLKKARFEVQIPKKTSVSRAVTTSAVTRGATSPKLFEFSLPKRQRLPSETVIEPEVVEEPELLPVKQEVITENIIHCSESDIFADASQGSSLFILSDNEDENKPILITDHTEDDRLVEILRAEFAENPDEAMISVTPEKAPRRRKHFYGECTFCKKFYDDLATQHGPDYADKYIGDCPRKCKGYRNRKRPTDPGPVIGKSPVHRTTENQTPSGFWDIDFTTKPPIDDDPDPDSDRTQDGL